MATVTFRYTPDYTDNDNINSADMLLASVEYSVEIPNKLEVTADDLQYHFNQWLRGLGYHPEEL